MATIVQHSENGRKYVLLGAGYGAFRSSTPSMLFGNLMPTEEEGQITMLCVSDASGNIGWIASNEVTVLEVDGKKPNEWV